MTPTATGERPVITFSEKPYRHYCINPDEAKHRHPWTPEEPWGRVPSVSTIVGIIDKSGPLQGYAARCTLEGIATLLAEHRGHAPFPALWDPTLTIPPESDAAQDTDRKAAVRLLDFRQKRLSSALYRRGLSYRQRTSDAAERGTAIHKILEDWIDAQAIPIAANYPEEWRGYIRGLSKFLRECEPEFTESEIMVGSARYGFAGRRDTVGRCVKARGSLTRPGRTLLDLKTSKAIYPTSMFAQLEGYDLGGIECGEDPTDHRAIVQVGEDGSYTVGYSTATHDDFLAYLAALRAVNGIEARAKAAAK